MDDFLMINDKNVHERAPIVAPLGFAYINGVDETQALRMLCLTDSEQQVSSG